MINQKEYDILKDLDDRLGWLARDGDGDLVAYEKRPEKSTRFWFDNSRMVNLGIIFDDGRLFQLIQWEDEEPYRISDLIKEYEIKGLRPAPSGRDIVDALSGSEETEMKKDKDWLSEQVGELNSTDAVFNDSGLPYIDTVVSIERVFDLIYQLDEPEILSQELPEIPKYVADWIEDLKSKKLNILESIYDFTHGEDIHDYMREHSDVLMRAWLDGYTVESEQKYYVINNDHRMMLVRMMDGKTITEADPFKLEDMYEVEKKSHRLTEQEIKDYDPRYWAFAVPVKEVE